MSKYLLEDMVINKGLRKEIRKEPIKTLEIKEIREGVEVGVKYSKKRSRFMLWFIALISIIFLVFALSFLFSNADITIDPQIKDVTLNENLLAVKDSTSDELSFRLMAVSDEENTIVKSLGEKDVADKATGVVIIYNTYSSSPQLLNIDTRLEGTNGKIYKTLTKIIVPGIKKDGTPGQVEIGIYGAEAGVEYNSKPLDFKILGFKGTPKYTKFYARSKGDIAGGLKGKIPTINDSDKAAAITSLKTTVAAKLLQKSTDYPDNFILYKDAIFTNIDEANAVLVTKDGNSTITLGGTLYGFLIDEKKLVNKIAKDNIDKYDGSDVYIPNIKDLTFSITNKDNTTFDTLSNINFTLSGPAKIVWRLDVNKFTTDLLGKPKSDFNQVILKYGNIQSANLKLTPFWKMSIPDKIKNIKVIVNYPL